MSYTLRSQIGGWGSVQNPLEDGETIPVEDDTIVVDDADLAQALEDSYEALELVDAPGDDDEAEAEDSAEPFDPNDVTLDELETRLTAGEWSGDDLDALAQHEADGKDRDGAHELIDTAREG